MDLSYQARIVRGAKVPGRLRPVTTMEGRSLDHLQGEWVAIVLVEWESAKRTDIMSMHLVEIRGRDGAVLDFLHYYSLDVALDQARAISGTRSDQWLESDIRLGEEIDAKMTWRAFTSIVRG
ncbi:MAG: hypothetical protein ACYC6T_18715 [Thermoleophilia bacterium]